MLSYLVRRAAKLCRDAYGGLDAPCIEVKNDKAYIVEDEKHIYVVFVGSNDLRDWLSNFRWLKDAFNFCRHGKSQCHLHKGAKVHSGFHDNFPGLYDGIRRHIAGTTKKVVAAGHSRGGGLANLFSAIGTPDCLITFGSPRVGNQAFCNMIECETARICNGGDPVTRLLKIGFIHKGSRWHLSDQGLNIFPFPWGAPWRLFAASDHSMDEYYGNVMRFI